MQSKLLFRFLLLFAVAIGGAAIVRAEDLGAVKARMDQRQGTVDALKERQVVGENNRGFVEARGALSPGDERVVSDENSDRRTVYAALAAQTGQSADAVGRARAQQLAMRSKRGVWVQDPSGEWRQKS
jgi:uncharacterized protein YdbL (DUF1318 family)